jgi:predicted HTH domain antitoxin
MAVKLAETDYWTFLEILKQKQIPLVIDEEDQKAEIIEIENGDYKKYLKSKNE